VSVEKTEENNSVKESSKTTKSVVKIETPLQITSHKD